MADSSVTIKIDVKARTAEIDRVRAKLAQLATQAEAVDKRFNDLAKRSDSLNRSFIDLDKEVRQKEKDFDRMSGAVNRNSQAMGRNQRMTNKSREGLNKFGKATQGIIKFGLKAFAIQLAAVGLSLVSVNAAFATGALVVRAYKATMSGLFQVFAGAGASAVAVLAALAAGQRQYNAAVQSARYGGGQVGLTNASAGMRMLTSNTRLAVLGAEALQGAFGSLSRHTQMTGGLIRAFEAMGDFAAASGDPAKAMQAAGDFIGQLVKAGKLTDEVLQAATQIGPEFAKAVEDARKKGLTSAEAFLSALSSGQLSEAVVGTLDTVNTTLFGAIKRNFQLLKEEFADFGTAFLPGFTKAVEDISRILRRTLYEISGSVSAFARGPMLDGLVGTFDRLAQWTAKTINENLPKALTLFQRMGDAVGRLRDQWNSMIEKLRPLLQGGSVLIDTFGPLISGMFSAFGRGLFTFTDLIVRNRSQMEDFGQSLLNLFNAVAEIFGTLKEAVVGALPAITTVINALTEALKLFGGVLDVLTTTSATGNALLLGALGFGYHRLGNAAQAKTGQRGRGLGRAGRAAGLGGMPGGAAGVMNMTAGTVYLTGPVVGGVPGAGGGPGGMMPVPGAGGGRFAAYRAGRNMGMSPGAAWRNSGRVGPNAGPVMPKGSTGVGTKGALAGLAMIIGGGFLGERIGGGMGDFVGDASGLGGMGLMASAALGLTAAKAGPLVGGLVGGEGGSRLAAGALRNFSGFNFTAGTTAGGAAGGALGGAAMGALIGSILPGPGTVAGALVGAGIGAAAGTVVGFLKQRSMKKESKAAAEDLVGAFTDPIQQALQSGDITAVNELLAEMDANADELRRQAPHVESFNKKFDSLSKDLRDQAGPAIENFNNNVDLLSRATGISADQISATAQALGINLAEQLTNVREVISEITGLPLAQTRAELEGLFYELIPGVALDVFRRPGREAAAVAAVDEDGQRLAGLAAAGAASPADIGQYLEKAFQHHLVRLDDPMKALLEMQRSLGADAARNQTGMYAPGMQFEGLGAEIAPVFEGMIREVLSSNEGLLDSMLLSIQASLLEQTNGRETLDIAASKKLIQETLASGSAQDIRQLINNLSSLASNPGTVVARQEKLAPGQFGPADRLESEAQRQARFGRANLVLTGGPAGQPGAASGADLGPVVSNLASATSGLDSSAGRLSTYTSALPGASSQLASSASSLSGAMRSGTTVRVQVSGTFTGGSTAVTGNGSTRLGGGTTVGATPGAAGRGRGRGGDTTTPRAIGDATTSRLGRTMARHAALDRNLVGRRMVTSSWRDHGLGSINSDHVTGNAYDLVGDNLGSYARMTQQGGGFAEFHGRGGTRHLHVVPGDGPVGDTMAPMPALPSSSTPSSVSNSYQIVVNPSKNATAEEIAEKVMTKIARLERSNRERR